jgi:YD repeat-containing protein
VRHSASSVVFALLTSLPLLASHQKSTDAEMDGFNGGVKSVFTKVEIFSPQPLQPDGPAVFYPIWCTICEYDQDENRIKQGQDWETGFVGETTRYVRDESGAVREQIAENEKGELEHKIVRGPFGKTEEEDYQRGALQFRQTYRYDQNGNLIEWVTYNPDGTQAASTTATFDEKGNVTEQFDLGPDNSFRLHFTQSFDPNTGVQTFTNFNQDGTVRLTFAANENRITNYWQQPAREHEFGSSVCFNAEPMHQVCETHNPDGKLWRTSATFADEKRRNPTRVELRDNDDQVQMAGDFEYEFDEHENWTKRSGWIWTRESGERKLHETDSRTLTYWK